MEKRLPRTSLLLGFLAALTAIVAAALPADAADSTKPQEFYELRVYRISSAEKQEMVSTYLEKALLPALNRMGIDRIGVFTNLDDPSDHSIYTLIPYPTLAALAGVNDNLAADSTYLKLAEPYFAIPKNEAPYTRIESRLMKAFAGMPVIEMPAQSKPRKPRIFELRTYESHNEEMAMRKVEMFNEGEIQVMRDVKLAPVFYGEMLVGDNVPNLTYMLSARDMEAHQQHWAGFRTHPEWNRMKKLERYKGAVSKITKWYLAPTKYSQL